MAYEMRIRDWSSDVCSSVLLPLLAFATRIRQAGEAAAEQHRLDEAALVQIGQDAEGLQRRRTRVDESMATRMEAWRALLVEADIDLDIASAPATLDVLDELRAAIAAQRDLQTRIDGIARDAREHDESVRSEEHTSELQSLMRI